MYNEAQKAAYIEFAGKITKQKTVETMKRNLQSCFNLLEPIEAEANKDFAQFNFNEMMNALSNIHRFSSGYKTSILSELKKYIDWCIDNNHSLDYENRLIGVRPMDIDTTELDRTCMFKDEADLGAKLNLVLKEMSASTVHNRTRAIIHLIFNGLSYDKIFRLRKEHVDLVKKTASLDGRVYTLSDLCCRILQELMAMTEFVSPKKTHQIVDTGHVIENSNGNRESICASLIPVISQTFSEIRDKLGNRLSSTMTDVLLSGIFFRMYQEEIATGTATFSEDLLHITDDAGRVGNYKNWYAKWKNAFNL